MTADDRPTFDDPKLKAAIRRTWGSETAPAALRDRVQTLIAQQRAEAQGPGDVIHVAPSFWRQPYVRRLGLSAAAAAVVLGVGLVAFQMGRSGPANDVATSVPAPSKQATSALPNLTANTAAVAGPALPAALGAQVVKAHDVCVRVHPDEHHLFKDAPKDNYKLIAHRMGAHLKYPVVATAMGDGWEFRGAALCPVGGKRVAHMMYSRDGVYLSVFSLPASAFPDVPQTCDAAVGDHPVAAFTEAGGVYCVVASAGVELDDVRALRDQVRVDVVSLAAARTVLYATAHARR